MPKDRLGEITGATIVEKAGMPIDLRYQTNSPKWWRTPLVSLRQEYGTSIAQRIAHVM